MIALDNFYIGRPLRRTVEETVLRRPDLRLFAKALLAAASVLAFGVLIRPLLGTPSVNLMFLAGIVAIAALFGFWPALVATLAASVAYSVFFLPVPHTFIESTQTNVGAVMVFFLMAVIVVKITALAHEHAVERIRLVEDMDKVRHEMEADRLRSALLTSISHDLKTPLAAVLGSATTLRDFESSLTGAQRTKLLTTVVEESERLNRFIVNLLDMTKLESGPVTPNAAPHDPAEIVGSAVQRASRMLERHRVVLDLASEMPMVNVDPVLFEQALFNLIDNAAKYSPAGTTICIHSRREAGRAVIEIADEGPGIPPDDVKRVFEKFYRVQKGDQVRPGTGLGLAISRGFVEAMGGSLDAANRENGSGAVFTIRLPLSGAQIAR